MSLDAAHYNYLLVGKRHNDLTLLNEAVFPLIVEAVAPLMNHTNPKKAKISASQHVNHKSVKFGRPRWNVESLLTVCRNYSQHADNMSFYFNSITAEFPSITSAYKCQKTIDLYLHVENDQYWGKVRSDGDCGVFYLCAKMSGLWPEKTWWRKSLIHGIFADCRGLFHKRPWWSQTEGEESGLQDVAPWRSITQPQYYQNWVELESGFPVISPT